MAKASRIEVYRAIDTERVFQDDKWGEMDAANPVTVGEFVLLLEQYAAEARAVWSREFKPNDKTVEIVRKIAAIAVNCMEQHGAPQRLRVYSRPDLLKHGI